MKRTIATAALAVLVLAAPASAGVEWTRPTEPGDPGTYATGAVAATRFYADHVAQMAARHPGAHLVKSGYQNGAPNGDLWTGEQIAVEGKPACWYLATLEHANQVISASCARNQ